MFQQNFKENIRQFINRNTIYGVKKYVTIKKLCDLNH